MLMLTRQYQEEIPANLPNRRHMSIQVRPRSPAPSCPQPYQRPAWATLLWLLVWVLRGGMTLLVAIVSGLLIPPSDPDKYRPFAPKTQGRIDTEPKTGTL